MSSRRLFPSASRFATQPRPPLNSQRDRDMNEATNSFIVEVDEDPASPPARNSTSRPPADRPSTSTHTPPSPALSRPSKRSKQSNRTTSPKNKRQSSSPVADVDSSDCAVDVEPGSDFDEWDDENDGDHGAPYYPHSDSESSAPRTPNPEPEANQHPSSYLYSPPPSPSYLHPPYYWSPPYANYNMGYYCNASALQWGNVANHVTKMCLGLSYNTFNSASGMAHGNTFSNIGNDNSRVIFESGGKKPKKRQTRERKGTKTDRRL